MSESRTLFDRDESRIERGKVVVVFQLDEIEKNIYMGGSRNGSTYVREGCSHSM